jgi:pantothenate kinase-related protein Tda10
MAGLLGSVLTPTSTNEASFLEPVLESIDPVFLNVNSPWSMFICGSQGSGKSHALSCVLESCLLSSPDLGQLP